MSKLSICVNFFLLKLPIFNFFPCDFSAKIFTKFIKVRKILLIFYCFEYFHFRWRYVNKISVNIQILRFSSVRFLENEFRPYAQRFLVWIQFLVRFKISGICLSDGFCWHIAQRFAASRSGDEPRPSLYKYRQNF